MPSPFCYYRNFFFPLPSAHHFTRQVIEAEKCTDSKRRTVHNDTTNERTAWLEEAARPQQGALESFLMIPLFSLSLGLMLLLQLGSAVSRQQLLTQSLVCTREHGHPRTVSTGRGLECALLGDYKLWLNIWYDDPHETCMCGVSEMSNAR